MRTDTPKAIYLKDYRPPDYIVEHIDLTFKIFDERTIVHAVEKIRKTDSGNKAPLKFNGERLKLLSVKLDGKAVKYETDEKFLTLPAPAQDEFTLEIETEIDPASNTRLEGLYKSGGNWCTQCEAEGFRGITYFPDRPDVMATFRVRIEADKKTCPVLLSNGDLIEEGELPGKRHFALWHDPFPKPCYLFALVAGDLKYIEDIFTTRAKREVLLRIYVREGDLGQCDWAMDSLKRSMKWDEDVYGCEYEYGRFNIVAVSDFNMGAMENTSLNIFNTALVLAHPETATDADFERVESVIAHEYFHNWTGNRITCRDWFQLSLKEGLTVFRDQEFSSDMNSRDVQRIEDVAMLRRTQFPEDAGPMAHPVRPDNYIEINNFYTVTVYEKGAEVIRMQRTLLGPETYRKATDLYFERHDGQAVTCEDFVKCMEDASGRDLGQFSLWYQQAGTPEIKATGTYDQAKRTYTLDLAQTVPATPGQPQKKPMHIPVKIGLVGPNGDDMALSLASSRRKPGSSGMTAEDPGFRRDDGYVVLELTEANQSFVFENIASKPVPSILRGFSAPVKLTTDLTEDDLRFLMVNDNDGFNRWEAGRRYFLNVMLAMIEDGNDAPDSFMDTYGALLDHALKPGVDPSFMARVISLPDIPIIAQERKIVDTDAIHAARERLLNAIAENFEDRLARIYAANRSGKTFENTGAARGRRLLQNTVMLILSNRLTEGDAARCKDHYATANNMTDRMAALYLACALDGPVHDEILGNFYERFKAYPLVADKWFSAQAGIHLPKTMEAVKDLRRHPDFNIRNPNRVRSLYAGFAVNNPVRFHDKSGEGYKFLADAIVELNGINPQIAARLLTPLKEWRRYTTDRQAKMRAELERIMAVKDLSPDVFEIVSKTLA